MKTARPKVARLVARLGAGAAALAGAVVGSAVAGPVTGLGLGAAAALAAVGIERRLDRRFQRRRALLALPARADWRAFLLEHFDHYARLPAALRARFDDDLRLFLSEARITGVQAELDESLRLLVAASAVTLSLGWPDYEWDQLAEVLVYPQDFDRDYSFEDDELAGQTHPWGTVILSAPALRASFEDPDDGYHVGLHEFAHLLDVDGTRFDGLPPGLDDGQTRAWVSVVARELERLRKGRSVLDPYGAEDEVEFMAVAVETFFEAPLALRQRHAELYGLLSGYFRQDPAAWDDARGLVLRSSAAGLD